MAFLFKDWFFRQLPEYFQSSDTYRDLNNEGLLQRYLRVFGLELDEEVMAYLNNFLDIVDIQKTDDKYLPLIATILGTPPSLGDNDSYRKVLAYAVAIYKVKGSIVSYEIMFNLLGLRIEIEEDIPAKPYSYDDDAILYDDGNLYDSECQNCSGYTIKYEDAEIPGNPVPQATLDKGAAILGFLQPINATFNGFVPI